MKIILSADIGKHETELMGRDLDLDEKDLKTIRFRTKMYDLEEGYIDLEGNSFKVELDGKEFIIGDQGKEKSFDTSKTNVLHKLCCYTAITQFLEPNTTDNEVYITLACPLSVLQIQSAKEEYKEFIKGDGEINIKVNDLDYSFKIKEIMIKAEGSGILYLEPEIFENKTVAIVDLGGLNQGFSLYINKTCKKEDRFIEECGTDRLIELVREQLSIYKKGNLTSIEIAEKALLDGGLQSNGKLDIKSMPYIDKAKENYLKEVLNHIKEHKYNLDELDKVVFVGGTTEHVRNNITSTLSHAYIPTDPQLTTVKGLYRVAFKKYSK